MCNLYSQTRNVEAVRRLFRVSSNRATVVGTRDAIFPGHSASVVRKAEDGERDLVDLSWGFVLPQPGKAPRRVTNTRDDKVQSSFWHRSIEAGSVSTGHKHTVWFALADPDEPRPLFAFAGIWRRHQGPIKKDGPAVTLDAFSFMTTTPNALVATVNHERMPVLLASEEEHEAWISGSVEQA
jgi:putative SOS response-associated peptidase YedK